jgi:hypothetical protein
MVQLRYVFFISAILSCILAHAGYLSNILALSLKLAMRGDSRQPEAEPIRQEEEAGGQAGSVAQVYEHHNHQYGQTQQQREQPQVGGLCWLTWWCFPHVGIKHLCKLCNMT